MDVFMREKRCTYVFVVAIILCCILTINSFAVASVRFYTIQAGTYSLNTLKKAKEHFAFLSEQLKEQEKEYLRIEKGRKYYIIRLGQFPTIHDAKKIIQDVTALVSDAFILKETDFENSEIVLMYSRDAKQPALLPVEPSAIKKEKIISSAVPVPAREPAIPENAPISQDSPERQAPTKQEMVNMLIDRVAAFYDNEEYEKAAEIVREGLKKWPDEPDLLAWYGATLLDSGFPDKAYEQYRKATELLPEEPDLHAGLGHSLLDIHVDKAMKSITSFKRALEIDPDNVSALEGLGIVYVSIEKKELAKKIHNRLEQLDQDAAARLQEFIIWGIDWGNE
jgi:tetratricopeptide (TPR) repeat protein